MLIRRTRPWSSTYRGLPHHETLEQRCLLAGDIVISEFQASNVDTLLDMDGDSSDWIEIHNGSEQAVDLAGWYLTDDQSDLTKWQLPDLELQADGYLVVFASGKDRVGPELHTNFRLSSDGEYLGLIAPDGVTVVSDFGDAFPRQLADTSFGLRDNAFLFFAEPSPGSANELGSGFVGTTAEPDFSVESGFFEEPFTLSLSVPSSAATIHYTLDSSVPTEASPIYSEPIQIQSTTIVRASSFEAGHRTGGDSSRSYFFLDDVLRQDGDGQPETWGTFRHNFPLGPFKAGDVVPANYQIDLEVVEDPRYRDTLKDDLRAIPTLSLVFAPDDLWSESTGIYSNPLQSGVDWERPVSAELIDTDGSIEFRVDAGARISGGFSRRPSASAKHSIRLLFKNEYGPTKLSYPWFGDVAATEFDTVMLRASYNFSWSRGERNNSQHAADGTFVQDRWAAELQNEMGGLAPQGTWVHLYLNGLYWGLYNPNERPDSTFVSDDLGGTPGDYDVLKNREVVDGDDIAWRELLEEVRSEPLDYAAVERQLDITKFADYMILNQFAGNEDWPHNNWYASRRRSSDGQWQFHSWDAEFLFRDVSTNRVTATSAVEGGPGEIFNQLKEVEEFRVAFGDRIQKHLFHDGLLTTEANIERLDRVAAPIDRAIVGESARWGDALFDNIDPPLTRDDHWLPRLDELRTEYFPVRGDIVLQQYRNEQLYPPIAPPELELPESSDTEFAQPGDLLAIHGTHPIYFTLDGSDPRLPGGGVNSMARTYDSPLELTENLTLNARAFDGQSWSALVTSTIVMDLPLPLQIAEIMYHPADLVDDAEVLGQDADDLEFIEFVNLSGQSINVGGARLAQGIDFTFPHVTLSPNERVVVVNHRQSFRQRYGDDVRIVGEYERNLGNREDTIELIDARGVVVSRVAYRDSAPWAQNADGIGASLVPLQLEGLSVEQFGAVENWRASVVRHGTPGFMESLDSSVVDSYFDAIREQDNDSFFDLDGSGDVSQADADFLLQQVIGTRRGDTDLNGTVDFADFLVLSVNFGSIESSWTQADFDGNGRTDFADFLLLSASFGLDG